MKLLLTHFPPTSLHFILDRSQYSFSILSLCPPHNMRDQVSHAHRTTDKIIVLYILTFALLDGRLEDKGL
jgi:hypothetical protein